MVTALKNARIFTGDKFLKNKILLMEDGKIKDITDSEHGLPDAEVIDCSQCIATAGFVDLQIYGGGGVLFSDRPSAEALSKMSGDLVSKGTTSFLITLATNSLEIFKAAVDIIKANPNPAVLGLHFEGPYLNAAKRGAHLEKYVRKPVIEEVKELLDYAGDTLKMMTVAPEVCSKEIIRLLNENNVLVSAGHSNATFSEGTAGFEAGIRAATHLFNAMSSFHHRDTGLPGAVFLNDSVFASIIADGIHVSWEALKTAKRLLGERLFLITDAVEESLGVYSHLKAEDRFTLPDGTLSGSSLTMLQAVANCVQHAGISLEEALRMATVYPATLIGSKTIGRIARDADADIVVFDESFRLRYVFTKGHRIAT